MQILKFILKLISFNTLPNEKILDVTKLKALDVTKMRISLYDRVYKTCWENGENAGYQHFLLFPHCFPKLSSLRSLGVGIVWYRVKVWKLSR